MIESAPAGALVCVFHTAALAYFTARADRRAGARCSRAWTATSPGSAARRRACWSASRPRRGPRSSSRWPRDGRAARAGRPDGPPRRLARVAGLAGPSQPVSAARTRSISSSASVRGSSSSRPSWIRPTTGGSRGAQAGGERLGVAAGTATAGPGSSSSGSAPPPTLAVVSTTSPMPSASRCALRAQRGLAGGEHPQDGDLAGARVAVEAERRLERGERELVEAQRAGERVLLRGRRPRRACRPSRRPAGRRAACRPRSRRARRRRARSAARAARRRGAGGPRRGCRSRRRRSPARRARTAPRSRPPATKPSWRKFEGWARRTAPVRSPSALA